MAIGQYLFIQADVVFNVDIGTNMSAGVCRQGETTFLSSGNDVVLESSASTTHLLQ